MESTTPGKFYLHFADENWDQAIASHNIDGFTSIQDARDEAEHSIVSKIKYVVRDHEGVQVWPMRVTRSQVLDVLARVSNQPVNESMIVVVLMANFGHVAAYQEKYPVEDYSVLKLAYRQLCEEGHL